MRRSTVLITLCVLLGAATPHTVADTWCTTTFPNAVFCDDFDRYCVNPPPAPQACPLGSDMDNIAFGKIWAPKGRCGVAPGVSDVFYSSAPWGAKTPCQCHWDIGYTTASIGQFIRKAFGEDYGMVSGTDLNPLVLEFIINGQTAGKAIYNDSYLEFGAGFASAPTDYVYSNEWCNDCNGSYRRHPIICQQEAPPAACPPISSAPHVASIAAGFVAQLDTNPCHPGESNHVPRNEHLAFFDGYRWYSLRQGLFPGNGDFRIRNNENQVKITIKSTMLKVELTCPDTSEYSYCEIPRDYQGPFNSITLGYKHSCQLESGAWTCRDIPDCILGSGYVPVYDNVVVRGGMGYAQPGACCFADTSCLEAYHGDCDLLGGHFAGAGTTCATTACCPPLPADHDMDGDVDLADFGWFQTCLAGPEAPPPSVPCRCADFQSDGFVDAIDLGTFLGCMLGPEIPTNPNCTD